MQRNHLSDMAIFVEVARQGGFRAAAQLMNLGPGSVSDAVQRFEDRLGVRLFERTTRRIVLTTTGDLLYRRSVPAIDELDNAVRDLNDEKDAVTGVLKINAPRNTGSLFLNDLITRYLKANPVVQVEVNYDDGKIDLVASRIDAVIRPMTLVEKDSHAVPLGPELEMSVVASRAYLNRCGIPKSPQALTEHDCICFAYDGVSTLAPWSFEGNEGTYTVIPKSRIIVNDIASMLKFAQSGLGIAYVYTSEIESLAASKKLIPLLMGEPSSLQRYTINYLTKRHMPSRLRAFIDLAKADKSASLIKIG